MNFYRSDFKHKIYGLYTGKYGTNDFLTDMHAAFSFLSWCPSKSPPATRQNAGNSQYTKFCMRLCRLTPFPDHILLLDILKLYNILKGKHCVLVNDKKYSDLLIYE